MQRTGKNLFDINGGTSLIYDGVAIQNNRIVISSIGSGATSRVYFSTLYEPGTYTFSGKFSDDIENIRVFSTKPFTDGTYNAYYGGYFKELSNGSVTITATEQFTIGVIAQGVARGQGTIYDLQLELGSVATDFVPYTNTTLPVTFPASAGTVYGGYVDLVNGKLVVDMAEVDLGTLSWSGTGTTYFETDVNINVPSVTQWYTQKGICSIYTIQPMFYIINATARINNSIAWYPNYIRIADSAYTDSASFKAAMSGVQLVYELATPITYDIDPVTLTLLRGDNNVWADTGDTTLAYQVDISLYKQHQANS